MIMSFEEARVFMKENSGVQVKSCRYTYRFNSDQDRFEFCSVPNIWVINPTWNESEITSDLKVVETKKDPMVDFPSLKGKQQEIKGLMERGVPGILYWPGDIRGHCVDKQKIRDAFKEFGLANSNIKKYFDSANECKKFCDIWNKLLKELGL